MSAVNWWFELREDQRVGILLDADAGDEGAQDAIVDVSEGLDFIGRESLDEWIKDVRSDREGWENE